MSLDPLLSREDMLDMLRSLGARLRKRGVEGQIYVVGGAAMAFAYARERQTRDIDAFVEPQDIVFEEVRKLTREEHLNEEWLNDTARAFLPEVRIDEGPVVLEVPGLTVRTAPAEILLAMKLLSARPQRDVEDVRFLMGLLDLHSEDELRDAFVRYYPGGEMLERSMRFIAAVARKETETGDDGA